MAESNDDVVIEMADLATDATAKGVTWKADAEPSDNATPSDQANVTSRDTYQQYSITDDDVDKDMLRRAVADTGRWAYGTIGVEVWKFDDRTGKLVRCDLWFDPVVVRKDNDALMRLVDDTREDFVSAKPLAPGVGLAGRCIISSLHYVLFFAVIFTCANHLILPWNRFYDMQELCGLSFLTVTSPLALQM